MPLNLPSFDFKIKKAEGKLWIFDVLRKKFIVLLPEEWVRQHFIHFLLQDMHYPKALIKVEGGLVVNERRKRSDIVVYDRKGNPWMIVECKSPEVPVTNETFFQAAVYNQTLRANYVVITNGLTHLCGEIDWNSGKATLRDSIPSFEG